MRAWTTGIVLAAGLMAAAAQAEAHMRDYLLNQGYYTAKKGEFEVELFNDFNMPDTGDQDTFNSKHQIELEYGVLDRLQLAYYEVYSWADARDENWDREEFKIEAKLRLAEAGQWPVDVALYAEYINPDGPRDANSDEIENKIILSRNFGPWNVVGNFIFERPINTSADWAFEYTAGVSYAVSPRTRVGFEVKEGLGDESDFGIDDWDEHEFYIAPGIYHSFTDHVRVLAGPVIGLTEDSDDLQLRTIVELEF